MSDKQGRPKNGQDKKGATESQINGIGEHISHQITCISDHICRWNQYVNSYVASSLSAPLMSARVTQVSAYLTMWISDVCQDNIRWHQSCIDRDDDSTGIRIKQEVRLANIARDS